MLARVSVTITVVTDAKEAPKHYTNTAIACKGYVCAKGTNTETTRRPVSSTSLPNLAFLLCSVLSLMNFFQPIFWPTKTMTGWRQKLSVPKCGHFIGICLNGGHGFHSEWLAQVDRGNVMWGVCSGSLELNGSCNGLTLNCWNQMIKRPDYKIWWWQLLHIVGFPVHRWDVGRRGCALSGETGEAFQIGRRRIRAQV